MTEPRASRTAIGVAMFRAAHLLFDPPPPVLDDPVAARLLGPELLTRVRDNAARYQSRGGRRLRTHLVLRSRYAEDRWQRAVGRGVRQLVLLGAGLDTFAWRQPEWAHECRIFEVDQPASQADKLARLARAGLAIPANTTMLPVDFGREELREALVRGGVDLDQPVAFSWLGVMMYLERAAVEQVFTMVRTLPWPSEIVFTFAPPARPGRDHLAQGAAELGEPWRMRITRDELEEALRQWGFGEIEMLTAREARRRYDLNRRRGLEPPRRCSIGAAVVREPGAPIVTPPRRGWRRWFPWP